MNVQRLMYASIFGGVLLFIAALSAIGWWYISGVISGRTASLAVQALGILGTVALAAATVSTVIQNSRTLFEMRKERQKPTQTDILRDIINPALESAEYSCEELDRGKVLHTTNEFHITHLPPPPVGDYSLYHVFKEENSELHRKLEKWDTLLETLEGKVQDFERAAWPQIPEPPKSGAPSKGEVISILLDGTHPRGPHEAYRKNNESDFQGIKENPEYAEVQDAREKLLAYIREVIDPLRRKKAQLQSDFGVPEPEIQPHRYSIDTDDNES